MGSSSDPQGLLQFPPSPPPVLAVTTDKNQGKAEGLQHGAHIIWTRSSYSNVCFLSNLRPPSLSPVLAVALQGSGRLRAGERFCAQGLQEPKSRPNKGIHLIRGQQRGCCTDVKSCSEHWSDPMLCKTIPQGLKCCLFVQWRTTVHVKEICEAELSQACKTMQKQLFFLPRLPYGLASWSILCNLPVQCV